MNLSVGIIGLPNVGKSTLFNALLKKQAAYVANYPFATVEPNIGIVPVPDERLEKLAETVASELSPSTPSISLRTSSLRVSQPPIVPAVVQFVDIAGLVKGASEGAGLGNKFLSHIREVSIIVHVLRAFVDENVIREGSSDPESDYTTIQTELMISDMQVVDKAMANRKQPQSSLEVLKRINAALNSATPVRDMKFSESEKEVVGQLFLLCAKPEIIVLNVSEDQYSLVNITAVTEQYSKLLLMPKDRFVVICAKIEAELSELLEEEQRTYLADLGLQTSGLERLIKKAYEELGLISFLTAGEKEVRAWTVRRGTKAVDAAGVIHTDFSKAFIKAEAISFEDFVQNKGWKKARELGKARFEGRDYIIQDGDVVEFKTGS